MRPTCSLVEKQLMHLKLGKHFTCKQFAARGCREEEEGGRTEERDARENKHKQTDEQTDGAVRYSLQALVLTAGFAENAPFF